jgi:hypothetical protein
VIVKFRAIKYFTMVSLVEVEQHYEGIANASGSHCPSASAKLPGEIFESSVQLNSTGKSKPTVAEFHKTPAMTRKCDVRVNSG